jgi:hypothetical protein
MTGNKENPSKVSVNTFFYPCNGLMVLDSAACCNIWMEGFLMYVCIDLERHESWRGGVSTYFCTGCVAFLLLFEVKHLEIYKETYAECLIPDDLESYIHHYSLYHD